MKAKTTIKVLGFILAVAVILFGGISLTGVAAQSAIPGDALYPVKTTIENTRLSLAQDAGDRAQMKLVFAEQRLTEITGLVREGRYREIREAVLAFEANINAAIMELGTVSAADPARAAAITQEVTFALTRYAQTLSELATSVPDSVKPEVTRALDTTNVASGLDQINGNENENANDNGSVNGNENENTNEDDSVNDNANMNANDNSAVDDNSNANDNSADDDNSNMNANDNDAVDDNSNANDNVNTNDNSNDSIDDNANSSRNANDNGDDDSANANVNADDNSSIGSGADDNSNGALDDHGNSNVNDDSSGGGSGSDDSGNDNNSGKGGKDD